MSSLGEMVRSRRLAAGLSQKKLGKACGVSDSEIMKIENGDRKTPSCQNLFKIAKALNFNPWEILVEAGYISENDISPGLRLCGLDKLDEKDIDMVQTFIDFLVSRKTLK